MIREITESFYPDKMEFGSEKTDKIFGNTNKRHEDLKEMLDNNKDSLKLDAMKRIIGMVAKGKNAAHLFPAVVKNVASKNIEVKKLVYVYLVRYAEEQQDLALLSISTFQKGLKDPNQLIRASALRVLSSIRVPMIAPIMLLAVKEGMMDMSPYVRKTTALALPKLYKLDPEMRDTLIEVIEKLLTDKSTLVIGSAIVAFDNICPERDDILKRVFAKITRVFFTNALANTSSMISASQSADEWSICNVIYTLTRFACRRLILRPDQVKPVIFAKIGEKINKTQMDADNKSPIIHPDLKQLLKHTKPLLQSRNSAVVVSVVQLYYHCAQPEEMTCLIKPLIRLLRAYREVECIVLKIIHTFCLNPRYRELFEPHIKSFYINHSDATIIKVQKLEIITLLANETNIPLVLREFQSYVTDPDKIFASTTIKCIGKCAQSIPSIQATCINGLLALMHSQNESVVSESVIVIKNLLRTSDEPSELTKHVQYDDVGGNDNSSKKSKSTSKQTILDGMSKLLIKDYLIPLCKSTLQTESADNTLKNSHQEGENDKTNVYSNKVTTNESNNSHCKLNPEAVSCIMWLLVSHGDVKTYEMQLPDILRLCAKCFIAQDILVKYQTLTLATQLYLYWKDKIKHINATQFTTIELITKYIFDLAKYDLSYDLRDKARSLRYICFTDNNGDNNDTNWLHTFSLFNNSKGSLPFENKKVVSKENGSDHLNVENSDKRIGSQDTDSNNYISPYQLGSLSHYLQTRVEGYRDLCVAIDYQNVSSSNQQNNLLEPDSKFCTENIERRNEHINENTGKTLNNDNILIDGENKDDILSSYTVEDWWALSPPSPAPTPTSYAIENGGLYNETTSRYERGEEANPEYFHENDEDTNKSETVLTKSNQSKGKSKRNNSGKDINILSTKEEYEKFFESLSSDESQSENDSNEGGKIIGNSKANNIQKTVEEFFSSDGEEEGDSIKHGNSTSSESMFDEMASFTKKPSEKLENKQEKGNDSSTTKPTMSNIDALLLDLDISNEFGAGNIISDYTPNLENSLSNQSSNAFNISSTSPLLTPLKTENIDNQRDRKTSQNSYQKCLRPLYIKTDYTPLDTIQFFKSLNNSSTGGGQQMSFSTKTSPLSIAFKFSRKVHMANAHMLNVELKFTNNLKQGDDGSNSIIEGLVFDKAETIGMSCYPFYQITSILPGQCVHTNMGIDFKESACPFAFSLKFRTKKSDVVGQNVGENSQDTIYENVKAECRIQAPIGEQILPIIMNQSDFDTESKKLTGMMHQSTETLPIPLSVSNDLFTDIGQLRDISHSYLLRPPKHGIEFDAKTVFANTPSLKQLYWTILKHFNAYFCPESLYDTNAAVVETTSKENISNNTFNMSFSAKTIKSESLVLFNLSVTQPTCTLKTYCSQVMLSDIILKELSTAITQCLDEKIVL